MIKRIALSAAIAAFSSQALSAVDNKDFAKCAVIDGDLARLECFDNLAKQEKLDGPQSQPSPTQGNGKWKVSIDINPVDDSKTVTLSLRADSGKNKWGKLVSLVARCQSNSTDFYINWDSYLGRDARVLTRVGDNKAVKKYWNMSTDSQATFHRKPIPFIKKMLASPKFVAQVTPYNENPITAIFNTFGLDNAIKPLRETCGW